MKWDDEIQDLFDNTFKEKKSSKYWMPLTAIKKELCSGFPPKTRRFLMRYQFSILFLILCCFYLLIFFVYPTLISGGYADACESQGLIYLANRHVCVSEGVLMNSHGFLNDFARENPLKSRFSIFWSTIFPLEKHRLRDEKINKINELRHVIDSERSRDLLEINLDSFSAWKELVMNDSKGSE